MLSRSWSALAGRLLGPSPAIGIDIGSRFIKLVVLDPTVDPVRVVQTARVPNPLPSAGRALGRDVEVLAASVRSATEAAGVHRGLAAIALPAAVATSRRVALQDRDARSVERRVRDEVTAMRLEESRDWCVDYDVMDPLRADASPEMVVIAVPADSVDLYAGAVREADLEPVAVDLDVLTLDAVARGDRNLAGKVTAIVDVGETSCRLNVLRDGCSAFHGLITSGVGDAASAMRTAGAGGDRGGAIAPSASVAAVAEDVHHALSFFWNATAFDGVDELRLCGGGATTPGLLPQLGQRLRAAARIVDPLADLEIAIAPGVELAAGFGPEFTIAAALALRARDEA